MQLIRKTLQTLLIGAFWQIILDVKKMRQQPRIVCRILSNILSTLTNSTPHWINKTLAAFYRILILANSTLQDKLEHSAKITD